ncbi:hypothetical protein [Aeromicrobium sp. UC242_57]
MPSVEIAVQEQEQAGSPGDALPAWPVLALLAGLPGSSGRSVPPSSRGCC